MREDLYAADALAVAYATMIRVRQNTATLIERLRDVGYEFEVETRGPEKVTPFGMARWKVWTGARGERPGPLDPPDMGLANLKRLERDAGALRISLRAWYEVVGSVRLAGRHPVLPVRKEDALMVAPFSQILRDWDESATEIGVDGQPFVANISPEQDHRITLPGPGMDGAIANDLLFVNYLRRAFEWGGFPGLLRPGRRPKEIEALSRGLLKI